MKENGWENTIQILREEVIGNYFFYYLRNKTKRKILLFRKEREYNHMEKFGPAELKVFKASRMTRLSELKRVFKKWQLGRR